MTLFEARLRAAILIVTTVASWTMLAAQARLGEGPLEPAVERMGSAEPPAIAILVSGTIPGVESCPPSEESRLARR